MIRIPDKSLPDDAALKLAEYQAEVDAVGAYADRVVLGKENFDSRRRDATFQTIRSTLTSMCNRTRRCMYCEDSVADEVEHIRPQDLYPEVVFVWDNYLYACGSCNGRKNNQFIVTTAIGQLINVTRQRNAEVKPPLDGQAAFINPRFENPLDYFQLDLIDTFYFQPLAPVGTVEHARAHWTIEILKLNERDQLIAARREAFDSYFARVIAYDDARKKGASEDDLQLKTDSLRQMGHPTVWAEMKRQRDRVTELQDLFQRVPEALNW